MLENCLVVEFSNPESPLAQFTMRHPGTVLDLAVAPAAPGPRARIYRAAILASNCEPGLQPRLRDALAAVCRHVEIRPHGPRKFLAYADFDESLLRGAASLILSSFNLDFDRKWVRVEGEVSYFYAVLSDPAQAQAVRSRVKEAFERAGAAAQIEVVAIPAEQSGVWESLQRALGEGPAPVVSGDETRWA